jgi:F-type H+-transporting ATPase subunit epsilon
MLAKIISLDKKIFEGEVEAVVVPGKEGQLTILPNHIPLICPLGKGKIKVVKKRKENEIEMEERIFFEIEEGILKVDKDGVKILIVPYGI